jgi:DNA-binding beta-propeller fold protein YncE
MFFSLLILSGCDLTGNEEIIINPKVQIKINKVLNDSTIELSWSKYAGPNFKGYQLSRSAEVFKNGRFFNDYQRVKTFTSPDSLVFIEREMPYARKINYTISVITDTTNKLYSGINYLRPGTYQAGEFNEVLINSTAKYLYLYDTNSGSIILFNYATNREIKKVSLQSGIGYCALGNFVGGSKNELYVPTVHGWVYILDAFTLETIDKIYIGGYHVTSVVEVAGKLFVSTSDQSSTYMGESSFKIYDRSSKKLLERTGGRYNTRLMYLEGSNIELIDVTTNVIPTDVNYYKFDLSGKVLLKKSDSYHGDHPLEASLIRSFPDGSKFITASAGAIYSSSLQHEQNLSFPYSQKYQDFAFNSSGTVIYGALQQGNRIEEISYPTGKVVKNHVTQFAPFRIFRDGNQLICLTRSGYYSENYFFIEKFNL